MSTDLNEIIEQFYNQNDKLTLPPEMLNKGAQHIQDVLNKRSPEGQEQELMQNIDLESVPEEGLAFAEGETSGEQSTNEIYNFFKDKSVQEKYYFLENAAADPDYKSVSLHTDLGKELAETKKELKARDAAIEQLKTETDRDHPQTPAGLITDTKLAAMKPVLQELARTFDFINKGSPLEDDLEEALGKVFRLERSKAGQQAIIKYLYKMAAKPGIKKYFSARFGAIKQAEETDYRALNEKNTADFKKVIGL